MAVINSLHRTSPTDDDADQIGYDTPRSGIATPQPDLKDKRLPSIMSYFGQVRSIPSTSHFSLRLPTQTQGSGTSHPTSPPEEKGPEKMTGQISTLGVGASEDEGRVASPSLPYGKNEHSRSTQTSEQPTSFFHPYPTPPCSKTPSERGQKLSDASADLGQDPSIRAPARPPIGIHTMSVSDRLTQKIRRATLASPVTSIVTTSSVLVSWHPDPSGCVTASTTPSSPLVSEPPNVDRVTPLSDERDTMDRVRKLTITASTKSGPPTPTRALSTAQPSPAEARSSSSHTSRDVASSNGRQSTSTSRSGGIQAPPQRGKLTIKIREGRGLRKSRDPYVVAVFQRSELISPGPRTFEDEDEIAPPVTSVHMGGIPISRQGSDSGRPMAIPMRSRQSSNTSISEYTAFRSRTRRSFTSPKWDAQAVLYALSSPIISVLLPANFFQ